MPDSCFSPESYEYSLQAGLLAHPYFDWPSHFLQKKTVAFQSKFFGLTAAGTAHDSHVIPYYILAEPINQSNVKNNI